MVCSEWETTLTELEQSLRRDPKDSATCRRLADAYAIRGRLKDTVSTYLHLTDILHSCGDFEHALQVSGLVLKLQPDSEAARLRRIQLFEGRQQPEQCLQAYRELSLLYIERGQGAQAIDLLQRARSAFPENLDIHLELAETHVAEGHIPQAVQLFRQACDLFVQFGQPERASHALRRMKVLNPNEISVLLQLGKLYLELDRLSEAEQELRGVLRQCLNHEEALMLLGQVCQRKGQSRDACLAFNRLISLNPECWEAHHRLAQVMHAQGLTADATASYLSAGEGYLRSGQRELAVTPLRQLLALDPTHPTAICHLANLGASLQPEPQALPEPTTAVAVPPSTPSGELRRELKRRVLPGEQAKQALLKPMPGSRQAAKILTSKPVLVKAAPVDETPLFMQSLVGQTDLLPDFEGSNEWLQDEVDQLPDFAGSFAWLERETLVLMAMEWRQPVLGMRPSLPVSTGWPGVIWTQSGFGKLSEELDFWAQVVTENPGLWQARAEWAELCLKLGLCDQAIELYREVVALAGDNDEMCHRLIQALIWNDQNREAAEVCLNLAQLYCGRNEKSEAIEVLQLLLQLEPQHLEARRLLASWTTGQIATNHLEALIEQAARQSNWEIALAAGQELAEHQSVSNSARHLLMRAAAELGHPAQAAQQARVLLEHYSQTSQWSEACSVCEQLMAWETGHTRLWIKLLEACGDRQKLSSARCQLAQELFTQGQSEAATSLLAESYASSDRESAEHLIGLLAQVQDPRALDLALRLNDEDLATGRTQWLEERCLRLLLLFPERAELLMSLGRGYQQQGRWEEALQQYQLCRRQPGWLHQSTLALALCLKQRAGMEDVARRQVERVLQVEGKPEEMEALRQFLLT